MKLGLTGSCRDVVDFGCGYGTFIIPAARIIQGTAHALDIEAEMVETTLHKANELGLNNVRVERCDFVAHGTGLPDGSVDYAMLFNILHCEQPEVLLGEAHRVLSPGGAGSDHALELRSRHAPRPSMDIRPRPEQCRGWAEQVGFRLAVPEKIDLPPHHYGWVMEKR